MIDQIIRSRRRTLGLQVNAEAQVIVRAPHRASMGDIQRWVEKNLAWIQKQQARSRAHMDERVNLSETARTQIETQCRAMMQSLVPDRVATFSKKAGLSYESIRISGARTRWGSCSRQGRLNFSWRLALAPVWVIDYVVAHELAHLVHHNHSKRFWSKVATLFPNFKEARRWLRQNQAKMTF